LVADEPEPVDESEAELVLPLEPEPLLAEPLGVELDPEPLGELEPDELDEPDPPGARSFEIGFCGPGCALPVPGVGLTGTLTDPPLTVGSTTSG
jgi:hypothetical protein